MNEPIWFFFDVKRKKSQISIKTNKQKLNGNKLKNDLSIYRNHFIFISEILNMSPDKYCLLDKFLSRTSN